MAVAVGRRLDGAGRGSGPARCLVEDGDGGNMGDYRERNNVPTFSRDCHPFHA